MTQISDPDFVPNYIGVFAILKRNDTYLFMRRINTNYFDDHYGIPCGKLLADESIDKAVVRELKEETGIIVDPSVAKLAHVMHRREPGQKDYPYWMNFFYVIDQWTGEPQIMETDKSDDLQWLSADTSEKLVPYIKDTLNHIIAGNLFSLSGNWPEPQQHAA